MDHRSTATGMRRVLALPHGTAEDYSTADSGLRAADPFLRKCAEPTVQFRWTRRGVSSAGDELDVAVRCI